MRMIPIVNTSLGFFSAVSQNPSTNGFAPLAQDLNGVMVSADGSLGSPSGPIKAPAESQARDRHYRLARGGVRNGRRHGGAQYRQQEVTTVHGPQ